MAFREHSGNNPINSDRYEHKSLSIALLGKIQQIRELFTAFAQFLIINQNEMQSFYSWKDQVNWRKKYN